MVIIEYLNRIQTVVRAIQSVDDSCKVTAITNVRNDEIKEELGKDSANIIFSETPEDMLEKNDLDGILIGTNCDLHVDMAARVMSSGIPLFLEKPVAITLESLHELKQAYESSGNKNICVSFPRRSTPIVRFVKEIIDSGKIGDSRACPSG